MLETRISCDGLMARLSEEIIESYDTGESGAPVGDIVTDLLAYQRKTKKVTEGTIGVTGTRALSVTNKSILAAFIQLQESIGGYLSVDNDWKIQWPTTIGADTGQQIRYRKNLQGITRAINYLEHCTKLHLESSDESLSDISIGPVDVDVDTDATYGYLTLKETYAAYKDWQAAGEALPSHVEIYKQNAAPAWVCGTNPAGTGWTDVAKVVDDDLGTYGYSNEVTSVETPVWTNYFTADLADGWYNKCSFKMSSIGDRVSYVEIDVWDTVEWTQIYRGAVGTVEFDFTGQRITKFRVRGEAYWYETLRLGIYECQFYQSDVSDDSSNWVQGADERTARCAIADYDGAATYQIAYTYANYLMAWDKIVTAEDIVARMVPNKYEVYSLSLLEAGILILDELKEEPVTYDINTVDLSKNKYYDFSFDAVVLGSQVQVINELLGIDENVRIIKLIHPDLLTPEVMELQLSTRVKDISDYLATLRKELA